MNKKPITVKIGCYFCGKGVNAEKLATDEEGNCIQAKEGKLSDDDNHFICKECFQKVQDFFECT